MLKPGSAEVLLEDHAENEELEPYDTLCQDKCPCCSCRLAHLYYMEEQSMTKE